MYLSSTSHLSPELLSFHISPTFGLGCAISSNLYIKTAWHIGIHMLIFVIIKAVVMPIAVIVLLLTKNKKIVFCSISISDITNAVSHYTTSTFSAASHFDFDCSPVFKFITG